MPPQAPPPESPRPRVRRLDPLHVVDVAVYVVVLNLAAEWVPAVIAESFTTSILTAVLPKAGLGVVLPVETWVMRRIPGLATPTRPVVSVGVVVLVLPGSKFVVLWLEDLLFGDAVSLGGFWSVTALIFALMGARWGVRRLLASPHTLN